MSKMETVESQLDEKTDDFRAGAQNAKKYMDEAVSKAKTQAEKAWDDVVETVKRHPGKALGITLAAGVAVGTLIAASTRRRRYSPSEQFQDLAGNGIDAWDRVKSGFAEAVCTLKDAIEDAGKKFK